MTGEDPSALEAAETLRALERSERRFRVLNERSPVAVLETDLEGRVVYANPRLRELYGIAADAPLGFKWTDMMHPDDREPAIAARATALPAGAPMTLVHRIVPKHGGPVRWVEGTSVPLYDEQGQMIGRMAVALDVTERLAAEKALQESQSQYRRIVETASEGIWVLDAEQRTTFVNPAMTKALGYSAEEMMGRRAQEFIAQDDLPHYRTSMVERQRGEANRYERHFLRKDGASVWMAISAQPVLDAHGNYAGSFGMFTDITERRLAEDRRAQLEAQLRQSQKMEAIGKLSGGIAHDFNNLLTVIGANASVLEEDPELRADQRELVRDITQATETAARLTRHLLAFGRQQELRATVFDLNTVVANMSELLRRVVGEAVHVDVRCMAEPVYVNADSTMIEQVLMNLVVNAKDAMGGVGKLAIEVRPDDAPGHPDQPSFVTMRVSDTGAGIAPDVLPHIFEPFFTTKEVGRGTGLGLAMVYGIALQHGGWVSVESRVGEGATFDVHLPRGREEPRVDAPVPLAAAKGGNETILVVEDETPVRRMVLRQLEKLGYRTLQAATAAQAVEVFAAHAGDIALVLTDLVMPGGVSGFELATRLQEQNPALKVIFTSGYAPDAPAQHVSLAEGVNFISKPYNHAALARVVRTRLDAV